MLDLNRAAALYDEGCTKGDLASCSAQAAMLYSGDKIGRDLPRAQALYRKTCDAGFANDCYALARTLSKTPADRKTAFELNSRACAGNVAAACHEVAVAWEASRELMKAVPFYQKACAGGYAPACERTKKLDQ